MDEPKVLNENGVLTNGIQNHCPYGCAADDLDENGYCPHLVGFTNATAFHAGLMMEPTGSLMIRDHTNGKLVDSGFKVTLGGRRGVNRLPVLESDQLKNPTFFQRNDAGMVSTAFRWVSSRVYREHPGERPQTVAKHDKTLQDRQADLAASA